MPGIPNLVVVNLWQIVGRVQPERLHVEAPYGAEERVGELSPNFGDGEAGQAAAVLG